MKSGLDSSSRRASLASNRASWFLLFAGLITTTRSSPMSAQELGPIWFKVAEESYAGTIIGDLLAELQLQHLLRDDVDGLLQMTIFSPPKGAESAFSVNSLTGTLRVVGRLDRESLCRPTVTSCSVKLDVAVKSSTHFYIIRVYVEILDINDHAPNFPTYRVTLELQENSPPGTALSPPLAVDHDAGANGISHYELQGSSHFELQQKVSLDAPLEPKIVLRSRLDREERSTYQLKLIAYDGNSDRQQSSTLLIDLRITDVNDNPPRFANESYHFVMVENMPAGTKLGQIKATDHDEGHNAFITYGLSLRSVVDYGSVFSVDNTTGAVFLKAILDFEKESNYVIYATASDKGDILLTSEVMITISITDSNDNAPVVIVKHMSLLDHALVSERAPVGTPLSYIAVSDADSGRNGHVTCYVDDKQNFALHKVSLGDYKLSTAQELDFEMSSVHRLHLSCRDHGMPPLTTRVDIVVRVEDKNDFQPVFDEKNYAVTIAENVEIDSTLLHVHASDNDTGASGQLTYYLEPALSGMLEIEPTSGIIRNKLGLDFETTGQLEFLVMAVDNGEPQFTATATVLLRLLNADDEKPSFIKKQYTFKVLENLPSGTSVGTVTAVDRDLAPFNAFTYAFSEHSRNTDLFIIDPHSGIIRTTAPLDRERLSSSLSFTVVVSSLRHEAGGGGRLLSDLAVVTVDIEDENDNFPTFDSPKDRNFTINVPPNLPVGSVVTKLFVKDFDDGNNAVIRFTVTSPSELFAIDSDSALVGTLRVRQSLVSFDGTAIPIAITATDCGMPPLNTTTTMIIRVTKDARLYDSQAAMMSRVNALKTLLLCIILVSVPILVAVIILMLVCCMRRRGPKPSRSLVAKPTNGKAMNGHATNNHVDNGQLGENSYLMSYFTQEQYCEKMEAANDLHFTDLHSNLSSSSELRRKAEVTFALSEDGHDFVDTPYPATAAVNASAAAVIVHDSNGTLPSARTRAQQQQFPPEFTNGLPRHMRTNSLSALTNHASQSPIIKRTTCTPPLRTGNGSIDRSVSRDSKRTLTNGNGIKSHKSHISNQSPKQNGCASLLGSKTDYNYAVGESNTLNGYNTYVESPRVTNALISRTLYGTTTPSHHPYSNNVTFSGKQMKSFSSDDDAYETVETPV